MAEKILITAALPYANGALHFGHLAGAYLPADVYARFQRLRGRRVLFLCGSDEYGVAITLSAELAGRSPKEHVDLYHECNKELFKKLSLSFDHYSRTTSPLHESTCHQFFLDLCRSGYIEEGECAQLYCEKDKRFLADRYVVGTCPRCGYEAARGDECTRCGAAFEAQDLKNPRSKLSGEPLVLRSTTHWYLRLDKFKERLLAWLDTKHWKPNVVNFVKSYIAELRPRAITRDLSWGISVPVAQGADGKVLYVWFDAPIGYITAAKEWALARGNPESWSDFWCDPECKFVQFVGKDNILFHAVIFPAMIMGQSQPYKLVDELPANEFLNLEGKQFSKSDGWYIDTAAFLTRYSSDQLRYALAANAPETSDSEFTWRDFQLRCNSELLGKFGNFINRALVFLQNNFQGIVPELPAFEPTDSAFLEEIKIAAVEAAGAYELFHVRRAAQLLMEIAQRGNVYFDTERPWSTVKEPNSRHRAAACLFACLECVRLLALVASPLIPVTAQKIWEMVGEEGVLEQANWTEVLEGSLRPGQKLPAPALLFRKIEESEIAEEEQKLRKGSLSPPPAKKEREKKPVPAADKGPISLEQVRALDLRVAEVIHCERVEKSQKLLAVQVRLGSEEGSEVRHVISGIALQYTPEELLGKKVVLVANLAPTKIMGQESCGMLLAAGTGESLRLVECPDVPVGSPIL